VFIAKPPDLLGFNRHDCAASVASVDDAAFFFAALHCDLADRAGPWLLRFVRLNHSGNYADIGAQDQLRMFT
jgi:hypothetical protein